MDVGTDMRRFIGFCGMAARQGALITEDAGGPAAGDEEQEARATQEKQGEKGRGREGGMAPPRLVGIK